MRRSVMTLAMLGLYVVRLGADVTITTALEGPMMALAAGGNSSPKIVTRIKGNKSRTDVEIGDQSSAVLIDLTTKQTILLDHARKTAQVLAASTVAAASSSTVMPKFDTSVKPTGKKREISGQQCEEFIVDVKMDMTGMTPGDKPDAAALLKGVRMTMAGFVWAAKDAPGSSEYQLFQSGVAKLAITGLGGGPGGLPAGMEQLLTGFAGVSGIPYLTELTMGVEGTGPIVEMMKQMSSQMKMTTRVVSVSIDPLTDTPFQVPDGYKVVKK